MSKYWSDIVSRLTPYTPGEQPKDKILLKLNTNENPYSPSSKVLDAIKSNVEESLRLYPDPQSEALKETISNYYDLSKSNIFVGNGSDEILAFIFQALLKKDAPVLFPDITYSFYPAYCSLYDIKYKKIKLDKELNINLEDYLINNGGIIFPNPNAPTGIPKSLVDIDNLLKLNQESVVVVDEAYVDFGTESAVKLVSHYKNLVITQSFSKSRSLAGIRLGCAFANEDLIEALNCIKNSFNSYPVDRLAQVAGIEAIKDENYFSLTRVKIIEARIFLEKELLLMDFEVLPSGANFVFTKHKSKDAMIIFKKLRELGVLVRHFSEPERISQYLRITIGTMEDMQKLISILKKVL
ncbi:histidinol-phosphate transaminase [Methylophilaceae bacterium]|jgi:histidinol-phosphate aminotransferase|nr:histidinol-phosphate transaminase [Methylophilaceae bacterium]|tara:strand:+ start:819 stop:1877 length:1059 start_codon:yes stop_codon:yes gene_type:complete